ncbi:RHS repeat domain-containing protein [Streptomyces xanthophaeus]
MSHPSSPPSRTAIRKIRCPVYADGHLPYKTTAGSLTLVNATQYDTFERPTRTEYGGLLGKKAYKTQTYDEHTGRPIRQTVDRDIAPQSVEDTTWTYDQAGNITAATTVSGQDATTDRQCFTNDALGRLSNAWTAKTDCAAAPSPTTVGGPDSYWLSYGYDKVGNRVSQTDHQAGSTTSYIHSAPNTGLPHGVQQATVTGGPDSGRTSTFKYDAAGNTTQRVVGAKSQDLTWDNEGHLKSLTEAGKSTSYIYDSDGDRLITKNPDGSSTLSLPNGDELKATAGGTKTGTRYYVHAGQTVAVRTGANVSYLVSDHQGTAMTALAITTLAVTRRKQTPFGELRTNQSEAFGSRGFVGGTNDPTGLTHLGAREYDPILGRFLSVDPIVDYGDPAQMNAYSYAHNNPVTRSDPDGLRPDGPVGGNSNNDERWAQERGMQAGYTYKSGTWVWHQTPRKDPESQRRYAAYRNNPAEYRVYHYNAQEVAATKARAEKNAQAAKRAKIEKEQAEQRKKDGIWGNIRKGNIGAAWNNSFGNRDWVKHFGINGAVGMLAAAGTIACIASGGCAGLFLVGAAALFVGGVMAHMAVATEEERARGATQFLLPTAKAEAMGMLTGALWGRGLIGAAVLGPKAGVATSRHVGRRGSDPLFAGLGRFDVKGMGGRIGDYMKNLLK